MGVLEIEILCVLQVLRIKPFASYLLNERTEFSSFLDICGLGRHRERTVKDDLCTTVHGNLTHAVIRIVL